MQNSLRKEKYSGLNDQQVKDALEQFGLNVIERKSQLNYFLKFLSYFNNHIIWVLLGASFVSGFLGQIRDSIIIVIMVLISIFLDFIQEYRANDASSKLAAKLTKYATVIRSGEKKEVEVAKLVPGDILFLSIGNIIPAEGEVLELDSLLTNESVLTGESFPLEKKIGDEVFAGTLVTGGWAYLKITKTGSNTKFGKIAKSLTQPESKNSFQIGAENFSNLVIKVIFVITSTTVAILLSKTYFTTNTIGPAQLLESLLFAITIAVGLTPELLPVIISLNLARGSLKMSKKGVLVKKINAIPDFGSMDVLCTDKTGTLTEDKIELVKHLDINGEDSQKVYNLGYYNSYFQSGLKNPLDQAILNKENANLYKLDKLDEIPYDFHRRRLSVILQDENKEAFICTKGQPEEIFKICTKFENRNGEIATLDNSTLKKISELYNNLSSQGYRVLAVCFRSIAKDEILDTSAEKEMVLSGLLAFLDPPKKSASQALELMGKYGIKIKILTGDNELVTTKVCSEIKLNGMGVVTGEELEKLTNEELKVSVEENQIFARINPEQKQRIISTLKSNGHVVGYLGDGINDAPSLKCADVGISVENAVDIAQESADIILLSKSLQSLVDGVIEGRKTFGNTQKYMYMALSSNFGNMLSMVAAVVFLPFLPMLPTQILFNNLLYDTSQVGIPLDWVDKEYIQKPKKWDINNIKKFMLFFGPLSSVFDVLTFFTMFVILKLPESAFQTAWFIESLATQILVIYIIRTKHNPFKSSPSKYLILTTMTTLIFGVLVPFSPLASYFGFVSLNFSTIVSIALLVFSYLVVIQIGKVWFFNKNVD